MVTTRSTKLKEEEQEEEEQRRIDLILADLDTKHYGGRFGYGIWNWDYDLDDESFPMPMPISQALNHIVVPDWEDPFQKDRDKQAAGVPDRIHTPPLSPRSTLPGQMMNLSLLPESASSFENVDYGSLESFSEGRNNADSASDTGMTELKVEQNTVQSPWAAHHVGNGFKRSADDLEPELPTIGIPVQSSSSGPSPKKQKTPPKLILKLRKPMQQENASPAPFESLHDVQSPSPFPSPPQEPQSSSKPILSFAQMEDKGNRQDFGFSKKHGETSKLMLNTKKDDHLEKQPAQIFEQMTPRESFADPKVSNPHPSIKLLPPRPKIMLKIGKLATKSKQTSPQHNIASSGGHTLPRDDY